MYQSVTTHPDGLPPPPSSSPAVAGVRKSTTHNHHHQHHHNHHQHLGTTSETNKNGRSNTLLVGRGESGFDGNGLLPKSSSSSSPPKTQDHSNVNLPNLGPKPEQPQPQKIHDSQVKRQHTHESSSGQNPNHNGGDAFLQWGHRKRSKRTVGDKFSGSQSMPPPPPPASGGGGSRGGGGGSGGTKLRPHSNGVLYSKDASSSFLSTRNRNLEDKMGGGSNGSPSSKSNGGSRSISRSALGKRSHSASERTDSKRLAHHHPPSSCGGSGGSIRKDKPTDPLLQPEQPNHQHHHHHNRQASPALEDENSHGKGYGEAVEWPRIYVALSRKEKEDDFFAMKGTKLPHRPKKRSKTVDKTLQCCFPGMWLSDLSRSRYEVKERKNVKKPKRRGLKGLESMDSESE